MSFSAELRTATETDRHRLLTAPIITDCLAGRVTTDSYRAFLTEAYHHVKHTVPLLMACGARLPERLEWLRQGIAEYIDEEYGHEQWILADLAAAGFDAEAARAQGPSPETELMVSYAYDTVQRGNPVGFFGMVLVLEGTSAAIATRAAEIIAARLTLPRRACTYLLSHGSLDTQHVGHFDRLMDKLDAAADRTAVLHAARMFYRLYGDVFRALPRAELPATTTDTRVAA
jgi:pyrroloquinoline quinone (PQQ) biosynthesis protein C